MANSVRVKVPATTANLGPGFDALGLALSLSNRIELELRDDDALHCTLRGEGADQLSRDASNIVVQAVWRTLERSGEPRRGMNVIVDNAIPLSRGLGSSAAARVGAVFATNEILGRPLTAAQMLEIATELEGHPDNAAAALYGGLVVATVEPDHGAVHALPIPMQQPPAIVALVPDSTLATSAARRALPATVDFSDAVFNVGHACLTLSALIDGKPEVLQAAMQDRLHQPYRAALMPWFDDVHAAAYAAGAWGVALSGAGPTVIAFVPDDGCAACEHPVAGSMLAALQARGESGRTLKLTVDREGTVVVD